MCIQIALTHISFTDRMGGCMYIPFLLLIKAQCGECIVRQLPLHRGQFVLYPTSSAPCSIMVVKPRRACYIYLIMLLRSTKSLRLSGVRSAALPTVGCGHKCETLETDQKVVHRSKMPGSA